MATKYNSYGQAVSDILKYKKWWQEASGIEDEEQRKAEQSNAQNAAAAAYTWLKNNGYKDAYNTLNTSGYEASKKWATNGMIKTRDYLYDLGAGKGLSKAEVDELTTYDDLTGNISLGGKNIGSADLVVDGVSYWNGTDTLKNEFEDLVDRRGITRSKTAMVNQEDENLFKKYEQEYEDLKNTNPFTTEEAKAIIGKYSLAGLQGRDNAVASGSASNGGNIDSFSAANAMRQQASLINQGQMAVLEAHQQKLDHARNLLSDMGVHIDRVYEQDETSKMNKVERDAIISESTGYTTDDQLKASSGMWDDDGVLIDTSTDYQDKINNVKVLYDNAETEEEKKTLALSLKILEMARNDKITKEGRPEERTYNWQSMVENSNTKLTKAQIESAERIAMTGYDAEVAMNSVDNATKVYVTDKEKEASDYAVDGSIAVAALDNSNGSGIKNTYGTTSDKNGTYKDGIKVGDSTGKPILSKEQAEEAYIDNEERSLQAQYAAQYYGIEERLTSAQEEKIANLAIQYGVGGLLQSVKKPDKTSFISAISEMGLSDTLMDKVFSNYGIKDDDIDNALNLSGPRA